MHDPLAVFAVCGTRPEAIKLSPVVTALRQRRLTVEIVDTGQHPDLLPMMLREAGIRPDHELRATSPGATLSSSLAAIVSLIGDLLTARRPALVLVQGDTLSAFAGGLAAAYSGVAVAHVEAGLRTGNTAEPFPEEMHRVLISRLAELHFAPTRLAAETLRREGVARQAVHITGNSGIDAFHRVLENANANPALDAQMSARIPLLLREGLPLIVATVHRRENLGDRLGQIAEGIARLAREGRARVIMPLHPNPRVQHQLRATLGGLANVQLLPALDHQSMAWLMQQADLMLTDSGGLQEEAPSLGLRTLVLREATERPEAIAAGVSELVALTAEAIYTSVLRALALPRPEPSCPFGDGFASQRIAAIIEGWLGKFAEAKGRQAANAAYGLSEWRAESAATGQT